MLFFGTGEMFSLVIFGELKRHKWKHMLKLYHSGEDVSKDTENTPTSAQANLSAPEELVLKMNDRPSRTPVTRRKRTLTESESPKT